MAGPDNRQGHLMRTFVRTHVLITFADPFLICDQCHQPVPRWHNDERCGCEGGFWNEPCGHRAGVTGTCPSWGPVDGCRCPIRCLEEIA